MHGVDHQRRPLIGPDRSVSTGTLLRSNIQNYQIQDQPPQRSWHFNHARVAEKLLEEGPQRTRIWCNRGTKISDQDSDRLRLTVLEIIVSDKTAQVTFFL